MTSGEEYFFRVKATNSEGDSGWSEIKSVIIGKTPAAPTTWSSTTTAIVGNPVTLYWVHNATDNSSEVKAEVEVEYQVAKEYLNEILADEVPETAEEPVASEEAHQSSTEGVAQMQEQAVQAQPIETQPANISPAEV